MLTHTQLETVRNKNNILKNKKNKSKQSIESHSIPCHFHFHCWCFSFFFLSTFLKIAPSSQKLSGNNPQLEHLSVSGMCGGFARPCRDLLSASCNSDLPRSHNAGRSPEREWLSACASCTPGPLSAPACISWTKSDGHSRDPRCSLKISGSSLLPDLKQHTHTQTKSDFLLDWRKGWNIT